MRHETTACDTTRFFAPHTIKWISSHICKSGRHDKKLLQQKSLWKRFLSCVAATVSRKLSLNFKFSSHICDTTRQHATQHDRGPRHDDFLVWCHTYQDTTMRLDSDSLQTLGYGNFVVYS